MFAKILLIPFAIAAIILGLLSWWVDVSYVTPLLFPAGACVIIYLMTPQINWWWYNRHPPDIPEPIAGLLDKYCVFYQRLDDSGKLKFRQRVALYLMGVEYIPMVFEKVPEDIKAILAAQAIQLTFHRDKFLLEPFERIVVYPHAFPSPQYPETFHASELFEPDGVLLFSADELMRGFLAPGRFYHIALHEYAKAFLLTQKDQPFPASDTTRWPALEKIGGMSKSNIEKCIGLPDVAIQPVYIHHFFNFPDSFAAELPDLYGALQQVFRTGS